MLDKLIQLFTTNVGTKLISIVIASVLWVVVLGSRSVEVTKEVPLEVITSSDVVPANEIPEKIAFRLSGPKAYLRTVLDRKDEPVRVNLVGQKPGLVTHRFYSDNIPVPIGVKVQSINPTAILVKLEYQKRKDVPVRLEVRGVPPEGFRLAKAEVRPSVVRIKGAESRVDAVAEIATLPVDVSGAKNTYEKEVALDLERYNVLLDGPLPKVHVEIEPAAANFRIKNVDIRVLSSYKAVLEEKTVTVLVRAESQDLKLLDRSKVYAVVDLRGKGKGKHVAPVKVSLPEGVALVKVIPEQVTAVLR